MNLKIYFQVKVFKEIEPNTFRIDPTITKRKLNAREDKLHYSLIVVLTLTILIFEQGWRSSESARLFMPFHAGPVVLAFLRGFFLGFPVFLPPQKRASPNFNSTKMDKTS